MFILNNDVIAALEEKGRGMALTLADLQVVGERAEIEEKVSQLETVSRGWWEDDADFQAKCKQEEKEAKVKYNAKVKALAGKKGTGLSGKAGTGTQGKTGGSSSSSGSSYGGGWSTASTAGCKKTATSGAKKAVGGSFAAAFGADSDSD